jgi:hypothetical protein
MFASWPMVIGALIAGVLVGIMVPSPKTGSPVTPPLVSSEKSEAKAKRDLAAVTTKESGSAKETNEVRTVATPTTDVKVAKQDTNPCSQQTWPYFSPSCIDRSAPAPSSFQVTNTRPADPSIALRDEKKQATAPYSSQTPKAAPAAPTQAAAPAQAASSPTPSPPAPTQAAAPAQPATAQSASPAQSQTPARATSRAPDNAQTSSADVERQIEQPRQRQQQRGQPRYTRIEPPDDDDYDSPRMLLRRDGTRVYVVPESRAPRGYWRSW